jgi:hypothetical protein
MKTLLASVISLSIVSVSSAGVIGWFTSTARDWIFIQATGGVRIAAPLVKDGKNVLPVEYCVQGTTAVTCKPTALNSGLAVRRVEAKKAGKKIIICVVTQVVEKQSDTGLVHYADLTDIPAGVYDVFYESADDTSKRLGQIVIK